jgi:hypothetical protein
MQKSTLFTSVLKEPLVHFLLIGFALFFLYAQINNEEEKSNTKPQIIIQASTLTALAMTFKNENGKEATEAEKQGLLDAFIREEVLAHEAMAMGLDKNDKVIRHRLAEKMSYLFEDISLFEDPSEEILKAYFIANSQKFRPKAQYENIKSEIQEAWIVSEQAKENKVFYENLKNRYDIIREEK